MKSLRSLIVILFVVFFLASCTVGPSGNAQIVLPSRGPTISPFLVGLWGSASNGHPDQLSQYIDWFRVPGAKKPGPSGAIIDPSCPLEYDYARMANSGWSAGYDGLKIEDVNNRTRTGYYNPASQETLLILKGYTFDFLNGSNKHCADDDYAVYLPVRLKMATGLWSIEGFASPAASITIAVTTGLPMAPLANEHEIDSGIHTIVSPLRLNRFRITDENFQRIIAYATLNDQGQGSPRRIWWFRVSDFSPSFTHLAANSACNAAAFAFWGHDEDASLAPCGREQVADLSADTSMFIDQMSRMSGGGSKVWESPDDDTCSRFEQGSCVKLSTDDWKQIARDLGQLTRKSGVDRRAIIADIRARLGDKLAADSAPPDEFGGWDNLDNNVVGVIASNGRKAFEDTKSAIKDKSQLMGYVGFIGMKVDADSQPTTNSVTLSPSFDFNEVRTDEAARAFYDKYSLLLNENQKTFNVMSFSTEQTASGGIEYQQSPLVRISITVSDVLDSTYASRYTSDWLPAFAIWRNAGGYAIRENIDLLSNFGKAVSRAVSDLVYAIYRSTVGAWMSGLSQLTTQNLLAVPNLEPYKIAYLKPNGEPVYVINSNLIKWSHIKSKRFGGVNAGGYVVDGTDLTSDELICTTAAANYLIGDPANQVNIGGKNYSVSTCYVKNDVYTLFSVVRGLMLFLMIILIGRYFLSVAAGTERRRITLTGFFARIIFCLALVLGMDTLLRILNLIVAEAVFVTNLIGTQISNGQPYSHLWLFSTYLNTPTRDVNVFALMLLAPFSLLGLFALLIMNWLRSAMLIFYIAISPLWIVSLLVEQRPAFFYRSLRWLLRLYLIPLISLVLLLGLFVVAKVIGITTDPGGSLVGAIVGMLMMIVLAVVPFFAAKYLVAFVERPLSQTIQAALAAADESKLNVQLEATTSWRSDQKASSVGAKESPVDSLAAAIAGAPANSDTNSGSGGASRRRRRRDATRIGANATPEVGGEQPSQQKRLEFDGGWSEPSAPLGLPAGLGLPQLEPGHELINVPPLKENETSAVLPQSAIKTKSIFKGGSGRYRFLGEGTLVPEQGRLNKLGGVFKKAFDVLTNEEDDQKKSTIERRKKHSLAAILTGSAFVADGMVDENGLMARWGRKFEAKVAAPLGRLVAEKTAEWNSRAQERNKAEFEWQSAEKDVRQAEHDLDSARAELNRLYATPEDARDADALAAAESAAAAAEAAVRISREKAVEAYRRMAHTKGAPILFKATSPGALLAERRMRRQQLLAAQLSYQEAERQEAEARAAVRVLEADYAAITSKPDASQSEELRALEKRLTEARDALTASIKARELAARHLTAAYDQRNIAFQRAVAALTADKSALENRLRISREAAAEYERGLESAKRSLERLRSKGTGDDSAELRRLEISVRTMTEALKNERLREAQLVNDLSRIEHRIEQV